MLVRHDTDGKFYLYDMVLIRALASEYEMSIALVWMSYVISTVLTFGVSLFVGVMVSRRNKRIDMVEALKGAE